MKGTLGIRRFGSHWGTPRKVSRVKVLAEALIANNAPGVEDAEVVCSQWQGGHTQLFSALCSVRTYFIIKHETQGV